MIKLKIPTGVATPVKTKSKSIAKTSKANDNTICAEFEKPTTSTKSQVDALLRYLQFQKSITTIYAREHLGIMHPAGRIKTLRNRGYNIQSYWVRETDSTGTEHKIGCYVLLSGKWKGGQI